MYRFKILISMSLDMHLEVALLDHMAVLVLTSLSAWRVDFKAVGVRVLWVAAFCFVCLFRFLRQGLVI